MLDLILCVDDDPITLMLCKKTIAKTSFCREIITANNGEEALQYLDSLKPNPLDEETKKRPEFIFLDLNMPVMGGWEFLDRFSEANYPHYNTTKVVVLSSTIDPEDLEKAKKYNMVIDFLPKPITLNMLEQLTNKIKQKE